MSEKTLLGRVQTRRTVLSGTNRVQTSVAQVRFINFLIHYNTISYILYIKLLLIYNSLVFMHYSPYFFVISPDCR